MGHALSRCLALHFPLAPGIRRYRGCLASLDHRSVSGDNCRVDPARGAQTPCPHPCVREDIRLTREQKGMWMEACYASSTPLYQALCSQPISPNEAILLFQFTCGSYD